MKDSLYFEKKTVAVMIEIYCGSNHHRKELCDECQGLKEYAMQRIDHCKFGAEKPACKDCPVHCYSPKRKEDIKKVMRFSGPKMLLKHPLLAFIHLIKQKRKALVYN